MTSAQLQAETDFANELRSDVIAIELHLPWLGKRRSMSERHRCEVADHFGAQRKAVGGNKGLYAPRQVEIKAIGTVVGEIRRTWIEMTIAYRSGIRLLRKEQLEKWTEAFTTLQGKLAAALVEADAHYEEILSASQSFLGDQLFDRNDYPPQFAGYFKASWHVHNFEPSPDLQRLAPETYQREQARVRKQFEGAVLAYEQEAREQLQKLVGSLLEKLADASQGKKVKYTEAATANLREFFDRFDSLGIRSDARLNDLVDDARTALGTVTMTELKKSEGKRQAIADSFAAVSAKLETLIVESAMRAIDLDDLE